VSDKLLLAVFVPLAVIGFVVGIVCTYFAFKSARKSDSEFGMAFWSLGALAGFTVSGMTLAYFIIPILWLHLTSG
jgi:FtsH-binding integral membrane protein